MSALAPGAKGTAGTNKCPWVWDSDIVVGGNPDSITVAKCPNCDMTKCRAVYYTHRVLVESSHKDRKTGEHFWTWKLVRKPIAFVYII